VSKLYRPSSSNPNSQNEPRRSPLNPQPPR
jgi:hypothetical protein